MDGITSEQKKSSFGIGTFLERSFNSLMWGVILAINASTISVANGVFGAFVGGILGFWLSYWLSSKRLRIPVFALGALLLDRILRVRIALRPTAATNTPVQSIVRLAASTRAESSMLLVRQTIIPSVTLPENFASAFCPLVNATAPHTSLPLLSNTLNPSPLATATSATILPSFTTPTLRPACLGCDG